MTSVADRSNGIVTVYNTKLCILFVQHVWICRVGIRPNVLAKFNAGGRNETRTRLGLAPL